MRQARSNSSRLPTGKLLYLTDNQNWRPVLIEHLIEWLDNTKQQEADEP